jgi:hypothetical protein
MPSPCRDVADGAHTGSPLSQTKTAPRPLPLSRRHLPSSMPPSSRLFVFESNYQEPNFITGGWGLAAVRYPRRRCSGKPMAPLLLLRSWGQKVAATTAASEPHHQLLHAGIPLQIRAATAPARLPIHAGADTASPSPPLGTRLLSSTVHAWQ